MDTELMWTKKVKYYSYVCRDCEIDFLISKSSKKTIHCPLCGEGFYTEKVRDLSIERPFLYRRHWTSEEDDFIRTSVAAGYTHRQIAESLDGRTKNSVQSRWQRIKEMEAVK